VVECSPRALTVAGQTLIALTLRVVDEEDHSERLRTRAELREMEEQYHGIFEATSDGLMISTLDGVVVQANSAACRMHGYTYEEFIGLDSRALIHPDSSDLDAHYTQAILAGGAFQCQAIGVRKDGTPMQIEVHGTAFTYHGSPHRLAVVRDVTDRLQAYELLEQRVAARTRELTTLLDMSRNVASTLEVQPLLDLILQQLNELMDYQDANILMLEGDDLVFSIYRGPLREEMVGRRFSLHRALANRHVIAGREPLIIADIWEDSPLARSFREVGEDDLANTHRHFSSWLGVPLLIKERVIGMLGMSHAAAGYYTPRHAQLALAVANQAAVAIENARLYAQAQELAVLEERQRLARELHDSVSQALYGIALGARTARLLLDRDPARVAEPLAYVLSLAEAGMAEMKALIFALRPEALATEGLVAALGKQVAAARARYELVVEATLDPEPEVPFAVKEALYRIAQEALHNAIKHAQARTVAVRLVCRPPDLVLEVHDDGTGFDAGGAFPGHLGLHTMRERAARLGATLAVESAPGRGTRIQVQVPCGLAEPPQLPPR
jgi:PAS domain S-box-containing protein